MATVFTALGSVLGEDGLFSVRLRYTPLYASGAVATIHTLLRFSDDARLYYRGSDQKMVLEIDGVDLESSALTFVSGAEVTVDVTHDETRRRIEVSGAATGNGRVDATPQDPTTIDDLVYVLGLSTGPEEVGVLIELRPFSTSTFAELAANRLLAQMKEDGDFQRLLEVLSEQAADYYDTCLAMVHAFALEHAVGRQLDMIGGVVWLSRDGHGDTRYRQLLTIQIELLLAVAREDAKWTGTCPNLLRIVRTFIGAGSGVPVTLRNIPPYAYQIDVPDLDLEEADLLMRFLRTATYGGVQIVATAILDGHVWDSVEEDVDHGGVWDSAEGDVAGAMTWSMVL